MIRSGETLAWQRLMRLYAPLVHYWCRRWGVDESDLDDLTQEVWMALGPKLADYHAGPDKSFRGWTRGIARHKTQDWHRRRAKGLAEAVGGTDAYRNLERIKSDPEVDDPEDADEKVECRKLYARALTEVQGEFEDRTWKAFLGVAVEAKTAVEVGAALGITPSAVRMAKSRVLRRLRQELGELLDPGT
jgi:RNA polymerase sigma-70 factor, ECF subfamily